MFTAGIGHPSILNTRIAERGNLRAFIMLPSSMFTIFTHLDRLIQALKCSLIIRKVVFTNHTGGGHGKFYVMGADCTEMSGFFPRRGETRIFVTECHRFDRLHQWRCILALCGCDMVI